MSLPGEIEQLLLSLVRVERSFFLGKATVRPVAEETALNVLGQLRTANEWRAIPYMVWLLTVENPRIRQGAADTISALIASNADALAQLDLDMRKRAVLRWVDGVLVPPMNLSSQDILRIGNWCEDGRVLGVLTMLPDGRAREAATHFLGRTSPRDALPFLLIRLNDWVAPIATAARRAIGPLLNEKQVRVFASQLPLVARLAPQARVDNSDLRDRIYTLLSCTPSGIEAIFDCLDVHQDQRLRHISASLIEGMSPLPRPEVAKLLGDADPMVRVPAARRLLRESPDPELLMRLASDRSPQLRGLALAALEKVPNGTDAILENLVFDTNFWIRDRARRRLIAQDKAPVSIYRDALRTTSGEQLCGAILGLGECGTSSDVETLRRFVLQGTSRQRQTALRSVIKLDARNAQPALREALGSDCVALSKLAANLITTRRLIIAKDDVLELTQDSRPHVAASAARILRGISTWHALAWALKHSASPDRSVQQSAKSIFADWNPPRADLYSRPPPELRVEVLDLLRSVPEHCEPVARHVRALLQ